MDKIVHLLCKFDCLNYFLIGLFINLSNIAIQFCLKMGVWQVLRFFYTLWSLLIRETISFLYHLVLVVYVIVSLIQAPWVLVKLIANCSIYHFPLDSWVNHQWYGSKKPPEQMPYPLQIALVLLGSALVFSLIAFVKGGPSSALAAIAKSGFTAAFTLIFVSEIGDKVTKQTNLLFFLLFWETSLIVLGTRCRIWFVYDYWTYLLNISELDSYNTIQSYLL